MAGEMSNETFIGVLLESSAWCPQIFTMMITFFFYKCFFSFFFLFLCFSCLCFWVCEVSRRDESERTKLQFCSIYFCFFRVYCRGVTLLPITRVLASITRLANTRVTLHTRRVYGPQVGTRWFTLKNPGMTPYHPLNHVSWVVFRTYSSRNPYQNENAFSQSVTPHSRLQVVVVVVVVFSQ